MCDVKKCSPGKTEKYGGGMALCDATPSTRFMVSYLIKKYKYKKSKKKNEVKNYK